MWEGEGQTFQMGGVSPFVGQFHGDMFFFFNCQQNLGNDERKHGSKANRWFFLIWQDKRQEWMISGFALSQRCRDCYCCLSLPPQMLGFWHHRWLFSAVCWGLYHGGLLLPQLWRWTRDRGVMGLGMVECTGPLWIHWCAVCLFYCRNHAQGAL